MSQQQVGADAWEPAVAAPAAPPIRTTRRGAIACRYANGVTAMLDFVKAPFGDRGPGWNTKLGLCPVRFAGEAGSVEVGDDGIEVKPEGLRADVPEAAKRVRGIDAEANALRFRPARDWRTG